MIVEDIVFVNGVQQGQALDGAEAQLWRQPGAWSWVTLQRPDAAELEQVHRATGLDIGALLAVWHASMRPVAATAGDAAILGYQLARYDAGSTTLALTDVVLALGPDYVVVLSDEEDALRDLAMSLAAADDGFVRGSTAFFETSAEYVLDGYLDVLAGLDADIKLIERDVFSDGNASPVEQIHRLRRCLTELEELVTRLNRESTARFVRRRLPAWMSENQDWFEDRGALAEFDQQLDRMAARVQSLRGLLDSILNATLVRVGIRQNTDMRKISAWVAIAAIPTMVGGIYGMNFEHMPETSWRYAYPAALAVIAAVSGLLYWRFRKNDWL